MSRIVSLLTLVVALACPRVMARETARHEEPLSQQHVDAPPLAIVGGTIHPVIGHDVAGGTLVLAGGKVRAILRAGEQPPSGMTRIDATGRHVYPGLVAASASGFALTADAWVGGADAILNRPVADSFDPWSSQVELAASGGITSAVVWVAAQQAKGGLSGRAAVLKMSVAEPRDLVVKDPAAAYASPVVITAAGRHELEEILAKARKSKDTRDKGEAADLVKELARGRIPLVTAPASAGDVLSVLEAARALDVQVVIGDSTEAWAVAADIAAAKASVVQSVRTTWGIPRADRRASLPGGWKFDAIALLARAGVLVAACPASDTIALWGVGGRDLLDLPIEAAFAQRAGLSPEEALASITIGPARIFGVADRIGSLEVGKDADVIIADGDILDYRTFVRTTIVNGRVAYEAEKSRHWKSIIAARDATLAGSAAPAP